MIMEMTKHVCEMVIYTLLWDMTHNILEITFVLFFITNTVHIAITCSCRMTRMIRKSES